ncbi:MAG TPA: cation:proton antiporter family protein, partial [Candidatus Limnocylindrales bacterium]|nr:cation:proton antiporter family protein [Candidatus Limnocylindrales bacterium]
GPIEALVVGAALAISSTLVAVKLLAARGDTDALHGQLAIGWSVVQDLATVVLVVTLPALTGADPVVPLLLAAAKAAVFLALSYVIGVRLLPRLFDAVARLGSSELFLLVVFGTALGAALVSNLVFGLSLALGAFVAGLIVSESDISYQSAAEIVPFRDLFAVLFFVSVGMLVDPRALAQSAPAIVGLVLVVGLGKAAIAAAIAAGFGIPTRSAILAGAALGHAGEFTFLLAGAALALGILEAPEYNLVLATTVVSIVLASPLYDLAERAVWALEARRPVPAADAEPANPVVPEAARPRGGHPVGRRLRSADGPLDRPHVVVLGGGRVGLLVARALITRGFTCVVVERDRRRLEELERIGALTIYGDAANPTILRAAIGPATRLVVVTLADHLASRLAIERIRRINPRVEIVARVRGRDDIRELRELGVGRFVEPNAEAGIELARTALQRLGVSTQELALITQGLRSESYRG